MSRRWTRLVGETSEFAVEIAFERDPDRGLSEGREISESWGSFQMWAQGQNLCTHDEEEVTLDSVHWYLLPLFEWLVDNWDPIFHEQRPPHRQTRGCDGWSSLMENSLPPAALSQAAELDWLSGWQAWWNRHSIQAARSGGLFPGIVLRRWRHQVEVSWGSNRLIGAPSHFRFTSSRGHARFEPEKVARPLFDVLDGAINQLLAWVPGSERIEDLHLRLQRLRENRVEDRLGWLAGIGSQRWRSFSECLRADSGGPPEAIKELLSYREPPDLVLTGSCRAALMFGSLSPSLAEADMMSLAKQLIRSFKPALSNPKLDQMAESAPVEAPEPWRQAYDLAETVLAKLGLWDGTGDAIDVEATLKSLDIRVDNVELEDEETRGVAFVSPVHRATILVNLRHPANSYPTGRRFTLAHELCHLLFDQSIGRELSLGSGPWAPSDIEKRANAFAAMFLMPTERVRSLIDDLGDPLRRRQQLLEIAAAMQTSPASTLEHLANLGFLSQTHKQAIEVELSS